MLNLFVFLVIGAIPTTANAGAGLTELSSRMMIKLNSPDSQLRISVPFPGETGSNVCGVRIIFKKYSHNDGAEAEFAEAVKFLDGFGHGEIFELSPRFNHGLQYNFKNIETNATLLTVYSISDEPLADVVSRIFGETEVFLVGKLCN